LYRETVKTKKNNRNPQLPRIGTADWIIITGKPGFRHPAFEILIKYPWYNKYEP
jgi:hypothetical protein